VVHYTSFSGPEVRENVRAALRLLLWIFAFAVLVFAATIWWLVYRPLPQLDGRVSVGGLQGEVTVERDKWGVPHIRAGSVQDMAEAQGYVMAQDRLWQMDLLRRVGRGQLSEIFGPVPVKVDKEFRVLNFGRAAQRDYEQMDPERRKLMEAYARGVNEFIEQHGSKLPMEFTLLRYQPAPWQPTDSLVIAGYMYRTLADSRHSERNRGIITAKVSQEIAKDLFNEASSLDHYVVGDPSLEKSLHDMSQAGSDDDEDDMDFDDVIKAESNSQAAPDEGTEPDITSLLAMGVEEWLRESQRDIRHSLGSNNWVVSGAHTATGKPLLANDTHLELSIPPIWYEIHITAPGWNVKGFTLPGAPLVVIGHNDRLAWGFTNNGADVQDLYIEKFNPANPDEYRANGQWKKAEVYDEVIKVRGGADEHLRLVVTRHGPIVEREGDKYYAMRWTALEPGGLSNSYSELGKAQNWNEFLEIMKTVWGPAQNTVYADVDGNIGYIMSARVPIRKKGRGDVPVPGDTDDFEWTGYIPFEQLPKSFNPESGFIVTANARVVGPDYKPYLTDKWEEPYRTARIYDLLHDKHDLRPEDMLKVQTDAYSIPHVFLAEQLAAAAKAVPLKDSRTKKLIDQSKDWNGIADANSTVVAFLNSTMNEALNLILEEQLGKDADKFNWRKLNFLQRTLRERPAKWLPAQYKNYDELLTAAADLAVKRLEERTKDKNPEDWEWRRFNYLDMLHPLGRAGVLKKLLSITDQSQSGTDWSPRAASRDHGPAMRFVANTANWDESILLIPAGESGQPGSEHYQDQFSYWLDGKAIYGPFSEASETKTRRHTLTLQPSRPPR
jgi:penicillin G amidase